MIHPEIKKFWESRGKIILNKTNIIGNTEIWYYSVKDQYYTCFTDYNVVAINLNNQFTMYYVFNNKYYYEKDALKIIKLGAFI